LYTSAINDRTSYAQCISAAKIYLLVAANCAAFSAVYEHFSFGVLSAFMIGAFAVPLLAGGLVFSLLGLSLKRSGKSLPALACKFWHAAVATATVGFFFKGALDIYGTASGLTKVYWIAAAVLALLALLLAAFSEEPAEDVQQ